MAIAQVKVFYPVGSDRIHGIAHYGKRLAAALCENDVDASFHTFTRNWASVFFPPKLAWDDANTPRIVHLQWPYSLPNQKIDQIKAYIQTFFLLWREKRAGANIVITFHEISWNWVEDIFAGLLLLLADRVVFTVPLFRKSVFKYMHFLNRLIKGDPAVIPIGSNIAVMASSKPRVWDVLYFGGIRRNKRLEDVLRLSTLLEQLGNAPDGKPARVAIMGGIDNDPEQSREIIDAVYDLSAPEYEELLRCRSDYRTLNTYLAKKPRRLPVDCYFNLPNDEISERLAGYSIAYYPYPYHTGGINGQRGAPLAAMEHGIVVISDVGHNTPEDMKQSVLAASTPEEAIRHIKALWADPACLERYRERGMQYAAGRWKEIAESHVQLYVAANKA